MPILDQSYQRWSGTRTTISPALILARVQLRLLLARRPVRVLLLVALGFLIVWGVFVYVESATDAGGPLGRLRGVIQVDAARFRDFFVKQRFVYLLLCVAAADLIALDRRHRALQIYLARPLRPREYVLGKAIALAVPLSLATWVPGLFLVLFKTALRGEISWLAPMPWLPASILAYSFLHVGILVLVTLAVSSLSASPRHASALVFVFVAFSTAAGALLEVVTRSDAWQLISINADLEQVASLLFGTTPPQGSSPFASLAALVAMGVAALLVLRSRIRPIEVVGGA